jgi:predicted nuclease of predicted toxin-antitoxin system
MKLLADEDVDGAMVAWLRDQGHDVFYAAESAREVPDEELLRRAHREARVLITGDRDFGELVYRQRMVSAGVVLMRLRAQNQYERVKLLQLRWPAVQARVAGHFTVIANHKVRVRPIRSELT